MRRLLFLAICLMHLNMLYGQINNLNFQFNRILFHDLADTIEKKIPVRLFYSDKWVDTLYLNINAQNSNFNELLSEPLKRQGLSFIITEENYIILSKGFSIKTNFRNEYLRQIRTKNNIPDTTEFMRPILKKEDSPINEEFKVHRIGKPSSGKISGNTVLSGVVTNSANGEPVAGVVIYVGILKAGVITNNAGFYSITLPAGGYQVDFRMIGMNQTTRSIIMYSDGTLDVEMNENTKKLNEVVVSANRENIVRNLNTGIEKISVRMLKQIPMGLGEADVIKSSLMLPGVQSVGEASGGYNVRGGSTAQNLILLNNAPIINSSHFFGFFSAFNSDMISDVTLYKSGMPAKYGGRISSIMEITSPEGNKEKVKISGGISPITGRLLIEGPLKKDKVTFIFGTRTTYSDWILRLLQDNRLRNSHAGFYDLQGMVTAKINENNSVSFSGYLSNDKFDYYKESVFRYGNLASTIKWKHIFSPRLSAKYFAIISNYDYQISATSDSTTSNTLSYKLNQDILRADFSFMPGGRHKVEFGVDAVYYSLLPGVMKPFGDFSEITPKYLEKEKALEPSLYLSDEIELTPLLSVSAGVRGTLFSSFGPRSEFQYDENLPRSDGNITDTLWYGRGKVMKTYPGVEYRISSRMILTPDLSVKLGAQRVFQYLHMISNTTSISPTDIWKLSDRYIKPEISDQLSFGIYNDIRKIALNISAEVYYKWISNILDYKGGAMLLMNEHLETDIINGKGKAYGVELMVKKQAGMLSGWISYTYSRVLIKVDGHFDEEKVNGGKYFPASYDKPHDIKIVANAQISRRLILTSNFVYNTGRPITFPVAFYIFDNSTNVYYSNRNEYRIPDYMRLDFSATINGNLKEKKLNHSSLTFTAYNVLGRKNPYSIYFKNEDGKVKGYKMVIFGRPIFMLTYNFKLFGNAKDDF